MDYFEILPIHPQPEPLESFTSYLIRLAEANGLGSAQGFVRLLFPASEQTCQRYLRGYPLDSFAPIATLAGCSEDRLRATTFFYLGECFGWPAEADLRLFLRKCLVPRLRYCPLCLVERPYYPLAWRFRWLAGCAFHGVRLLDRCGHCQHAAPVFGPPLRIGVCPACGGRYGDCIAETLTGSDLARVQSRSQDLEYLLTPRGPKTRDLFSAEQIGAQYAIQRHARSLSLEDIARRTNLPIAKLEGLEAGDLQKGVRFQDYLAYADGLDMSVRGLLETVVSSADLERIRPTPSLANDEAGIIPLGPPQRLKDMEMLREALQLVDALGRQAEPISLAQVARHLRVSARRLRASSLGTRLVRHIEAALDQQRTERALKKREALAQRVAQAVAELQARQQPITRSTLLAATGLPAWQLDLYPSLSQFY